MTDLSADVVIVGAGAAGAAAAWRLATQGVRTLCLEQGDWVAPETAPSAAADWEIQRQRAWHPNPNIRRAPPDYPIDDADSPIKPLLFNGVGGSTILWSCHMPRFHPADFATRRLDGVGDDWPIGYADLAPYYDLNERMTGVAGLSGHAAYPPIDAPRTPPMGLSPAMRRIAGAFDALGWSWWPADLALNTGEPRPGRGVCNQCGPCELACPRRAKASADIVYWPEALAAGARLITGARVFEIAVDAEGRALGAGFVDRAGARRRVRASTVMLAANSLGTPRLMLLSASKAHPRGLANRSGLVGRRLMLHPLARVGGRFLQPLEPHRGLTAGTIVSHHFSEPPPRSGLARGIKLQALGAPGPALTALGALGARPPWGARHHARFAELFGHVASLSICSDDAPDPENRVSLSDRLVDGDGLPAPKMRYRLAAETRRALDFGLERAREALRAAGAAELIETPLVRDAGFHLMGGARMGADPETAVLDRFGEAHDAPGLFVIDGSAFVTAAAVNPTNTIQAIALRAADRIVATRRARPGAA